MSVGLVVGMPTRGKKVGFEWALNLAVQNYPMNVHRCINVKKCVDYGAAKNRKPGEVGVDEGRNMIVRNAIEMKAPYIYFWDDDVAPPPNACRLLLYDLEQDDDLWIAGGIYCSKEDPPQPLVFKGDGVGSYWKWKAGERFECTGLGTGAMMIRTEIFSKLPEPWFKTLDEDMPPEGYTMLRQTDDLYFCNRVIEAGGKILADANVLCVHWDYDTDPPKAYYLPLDSYPMQGAEIRPVMTPAGGANGANV
jgi:hypothetical protein